MRFMLMPGLIFGVAALLATDVALASGENAPEDGRYAQGYLPSAPSAYVESAPSNEAKDQQLKETGTGEEGAETKSGGDTTSGDTTSGERQSGDTTSGSE